jgi:hypothetical protein
MSDDYETYLKISGEASMQVESFVHEIRKNAADGQRFGVNLDVERVKIEETETGFKKANE